MANHWLIMANNWLIMVNNWLIVYGGVLKWASPWSSSIYWWDFPWNKAFSDKGVPPWRAGTPPIPIILWVLGPPQCELFLQGPGGSGGSGNLRAPIILGLEMVIYQCSLRCCWQEFHIFPCDISRSLAILVWGAGRGPKRSGNWLEVGELLAFWWIYDISALEITWMGRYTNLIIYIWGSPSLCIAISKKTWNGGPW